MPSQPKRGGNCRPPLAFVSPVFRLRRKFTRPAPCKQACRSWAVKPNRRIAKQCPEEFMPSQPKRGGSCRPPLAFVSPDFRLWRKFTRPAPCKQACRASGGETEPKHRGSNARKNLCHPSQKEAATAASFWLGWPDSNRRIPESKSGALPLGDIPI